MNTRLMSDKERWKLNSLTSKILDTKVQDEVEKQSNTKSLKKFQRARLRNLKVIHENQTTENLNLLLEHQQSNMLNLPKAQLLEELCLETMAVGMKELLSFLRFQEANHTEDRHTEGSNN